MSKAVKNGTDRSIALRTIIDHMVAETPGDWEVDFTRHALKLRERIRFKAEIGVLDH